MINPTECEKGIHILAEKYAYKRKKETFIFLQDAYTDFRENVNLLLQNITDRDRIEKEHREKGIARKRNHKGIYTGKIPEMIKFSGKEYRVKTWREVLCKVAEEIYKEKRDFSPALKIKGRKRVYFSENNGDLFAPQEIKGTPYFCEGNISADGIVRLTRQFLDVFGYSQNDLEIIFK